MLLYICIFLMIMSIVYFIYKLYIIRTNSRDNDDGKITQQEFFDILAQQLRSLGPEEAIGSEPTIFMVVRPDCPACAVMYPEISSLARMLPFIANKPIHVLRVISDEHPSIIKDAKIDAVPTLCFYNNGKYVKQIEELGIERWIHFLKSELPDYFEASTKPTKDAEQDDDAEQDNVSSSSDGESGNVVEDEDDPEQ